MAKLTVDSFVEKVKATGKDVLSYQDILGEVAKADVKFGHNPTYPNTALLFGKYEVYAKGTDITKAEFNVVLVVRGANSFLAIQ